MASNQNQNRPNNTPATPPAPATPDVGEEIAEARQAAAEEGAGKGAAAQPQIMYVQPQPARPVEVVTEERLKTTKADNGTITAHIGGD